jgi:hypothetical protein
LESYYDRTPSMHPDGTRVFQTPLDRKREEQVAKVVEKVWNCRLRHFGSLSPIDWYAVRYDRLVGLLELKCRSHTASQFPTVYLNVRKWLAMLLASNGLGVPPIFIVRFTDGIRWIDVREVNASQVSLAGCGQVRKGASIEDVEPIIEVDVRRMRVLAD